MALFDNTFLTLVLHPSARPPIDPATKKPIERLAERIELVLEQLSQRNEQIFIPAPVLAEFLILAGNDGPKYLSAIDSRRNFVHAPFDTRAAVELATIHHLIAAEGEGKRGRQKGSTWAKVKFDRQIVAIAITLSKQTIYSDDGDLCALAERAGLRTVQTWHLPLPEGEEVPPLIQQIAEVEAKAEAEAEAEIKNESKLDREHELELESEPELNPETEPAPE